jgi:XapX domain-containing protein
MIKTIVGLILGLLIGIGCRCFDVPVPSPPKLLGALLVVAMTVGYMATDSHIPAKSDGSETSRIRNPTGRQTMRTANQVLRQGQRGVRKAAVLIASVFASVVCHSTPLLAANPVPFIELRTNDTFEPRLVFDDHCRSFYLQELLFLEISEETRHGLS